MKKCIVAFDLDGTLTWGDTLWAFLCHIEPCAIKRYAIIARYLPLMLYSMAVKRHRGRAKEKLLMSFTRHFSSQQLTQKCNDFADRIENMLRQSMKTALENHLQQGDTVVIVSASLRMWIEPWAKRRGIEVIATESDGKQFTSPNCNADEKARRLLKRFPDRESYTLIAYGNSGGDAAMLELADVPHLIKK